MSHRQMSPSRRLAYLLLTPLLRALLALLWHTYRVTRTSGADIGQQLIADKTVCIPCYWHQQHLACANEIRRWIANGFEASIVISASVDGEIPSRIAGAWGAEIIRGSANQTGSLVMRDMHRTLKRGRSIITTPDGPKGPIYEFKAGNILMARIAKAPLVPLACAADRCWYLDSWDRMMVPKPFARVVIAVGEPYLVPGDTPVGELESHRARMQDILMSLMDRCRQAL
ncbi:MAG: lysophospholipid acyltransferase family protein [Woeseia sp.]